MQSSHGTIRTPAKSLAEYAAKYDHPTYSPFIVQHFLHRQEEELRNKAEGLALKFKDDPEPLDRLCNFSGFMVMVSIIAGIISLFGGMFVVSFAYVLGDPNTYTKLLFTALAVFSSGLSVSVFNILESYFQQMYKDAKLLKCETISMDDNARLPDIVHITFERARRELGSKLVGRTYKLGALYFLELEYLHRDDRPEKRIVAGWCIDSANRMDPVRLIEYNNRIHYDIPQMITVPA